MDSGQKNVDRIAEGVERSAASTTDVTRYGQRSSASIEASTAAMNPTVASIGDTTCSTNKPVSDWMTMSCSIDATATAAMGGVAVMSTLLFDTAFSKPDIAAGEPVFSRPSVAKFCEVEQSC
jgi:hypothetical protein